MNNIKDLNESEIAELAEIAESWDSSDFRSRYAHLQDTKDLDTDPGSMV